MRHSGSSPEPGGQGFTAVCGLDDPVRRSLYEYVVAQGAPVGRDEAAASAKIGRPLAAYHLDRLVDLGLLAATYRRPSGRSGPGSGRPAKVYARSGREFVVTVPPREYELAAMLLAEAVESEVAGSARAGLLRIARNFGEELGRRAGLLTEQAPPAEQDQAVERGQPAAPGDPVAPGEPGPEIRVIQETLAGYGFEPWLDEDGSLRLRNCPFHGLATRYPDLVCGMNLELIAGVVSGLAATGLRAALDPGPGRCCVAVSCVAVSTGPQPRHSGRTGASCRTN
ncbi:MAG TPA: transcriptional regulator [Streptosporangiaceae bacterium]|nr:transcriptional regulator [Streptosporangiaceae bacterium]